MTRLSINLLGPFQVSLDGKISPEFEYDKVRALLAYLVVEADRPHRRGALGGLLWPEYTEKDARNSLRTALAKLRQAIGDRTADPPFLHISREDIQFNIESDYRLDAREFSALLDACEPHSHRRLDTCMACAGRQESAAALYRGDFLAGFSLADSALFDYWVVTRREGWHRQALEALYNLATYYERRGEYRRAYQHAARQISLEPWREEAHRQAMRALAFDGQRSAALAQYERCREILEAELGVVPAPETTFLYERIRSGSLGESPADRRIAGTVPEPTTSLVGREKELAEIRDMLLDPNCRLLTLTGLGGIGKTRLAQAATRRMELDFPHGAAFVPLASLSSNQDVAPTVAEALDFQLQGSQSETEQLLAYLREKELLLVLDNFEQLLTGADLLVELMRAAPGVVLLVTSRQRLNLHAEWIIDLPGLDYPTELAAEDLESYSAVQLFIQRARQVQRGFSMSPADAPAVAHICRICQGMPLAIELAAATVRYQSCPLIAGQLQNNWQALTASYSDVPERHRSILAAFEHSWSLLSVEEQGVFCRLSIFQGGFDHQAASPVAQSSREELEALVDKSLLQRVGASRFDMHPLIKQYAGEKLVQRSQYEQTSRRHLEYFLALAEEGEQKLKDGDQLSWANRLELEQQNIFAAIKWGMSADLEGAARLAAANWLFWFMRGHLEQGRQRYEALLARSPELPDALQARVLTGCAAMAWLQGDLERTKAVSEEGLKLYKELGDREGIAISLHHLGIVHMNRGEAAAAVALKDEMLTLTRTLPDSWLESVALITIGEGYREQGQYAAAKSAYTQALILDQERGDRWSSLYAQANLADIAFEQGEISETRERYEELLPLAEDLGDKQILSGIYNNLGRIDLDGGDLVQATSHFEQALAISQDLGSVRAIAESHINIGDAAARHGAYEQAAAAYQAGVRYNRQATYQSGILTSLERLAELTWLRSEAHQAVCWFAASEAERERSKLPRTPVEQLRYEHSLRNIREKMDEAAFARLWATGATIALDEALKDTLQESLA